MIRVHLILFSLICACTSHVAAPAATTQDGHDATIAPVPQLLVGAQQLDKLLPLLKDRRVGLLVNHTALVGNRHLVDTLTSLRVNIKKIFGPEHGFRGNAADGEVVKNGADTKTGLPVISLYGKNKKPTTEQLADLDLVVFDVQDVGTRFYTYISTLHYLMEACAESGKKVIVLDRPNPHGGYIDGPILEPAYKSFVGMHPIPVVHGMTVGELARMINGEGWLANGVKCDLEVIKMQNWKHGDDYQIPIAPSPNLPNNQAIKLYPSLCFFEGTAISVGRGTEMPFQVIGNPLLTGYSFSFTPVTIKGVANNPPQENKLCYGIDLRKAATEKRINLSYLIEMYKAYPDKENFFTNPFDKNYIDKLAGTATFKQQIKDGLNEDQIRQSWKKGLDDYQLIRQKYLLYP